MGEDRQPVISVIVATRNRARSLRNLLASLDRVQPPPVPYEVIVVDNGSEDDTPVLLRQWVGAGEGRLVVCEPQPGLSVARNAGIRKSRGQWLAFVDDDEVVEPGYLVQLWEYCRQTDCAAAQGAILWPPEAQTDVRLRKLLQRYPDMIPHVDHPPQWQPQTLVGGNMLIRRAALQKGGLFDERLGAGTSGFAEDDDIAERILKTGGRIGYMPAVKVIHEIDASRLTDAAFFERCRKLGRSAAVRKPRPVWTSIVPRLAVTGLRIVFATIFGGTNRRLRALARWYRYRGMLEVARRSH